MRIFKKIINIFKTFKIAEGDYLAKITDVTIKYKGKACPQIVFDYMLQNIETGDFVTHKETLVGDFYLLRCRDLMCFLDRNAIDYNDFTDLIGAVFEVTIGYDLVCGKLLPTLLYQEVVTPPPSDLITKGGVTI